jgi:HNH endonuclease
MGRPTYLQTKELICKECGIQFLRYAPASKHYKFCSQECYQKQNHLEKHASWKGGRVIDKHTGYILISLGHGQRRREHTLKAEKVLGRRLHKGECIHHINGDKTDNRNCNLLICTNSYHRMLERRMAHLYQQEHFSKVI